MSSSVPLEVESLSVALSETAASRPAALPRLAVACGAETLGTYYLVLVGLGAEA